MTLISGLSRRSAFSLGSCFLMLAPLAIHAQVATETKATDAKQTEAPAPGEAYTLRMKFKQGDVNRYKSQVKMSVTAPSGAGGETKTTDNHATTVTEQKTTKLLDNGGAEVVVTTLNVKTESDGKPADVPTVPPITMQINAVGKVLSTKAEGDASADVMKSLFTSGFSSPQSFLPDAAVKVGDKWTQKLTLPGPLSGKDGTMDCNFVRVETVNGVKTALIHAIMKVPMLIMLDMMGQTTKVEGDAMALFDGTITSNMDINFAIDEGRILKTVSNGGSEIAIKLGKAAPPEAASFLPEGSKVAMKMTMDLSLLAPGEKVDAPKAEEVKPEKK